jgi:hypothetical protein
MSICFARYSLWLSRFPSPSLFISVHFISSLSLSLLSLSFYLSLSLFKQLSLPMVVLLGDEDSIIKLAMSHTCRGQRQYEKLGHNATGTSKILTHASAHEAL